MKKILSSILCLVLFLITSGITFAEFSDVSSSYPYKTAIDWMEKNEIVIGYSDGTFKPMQEINRAEFLKMIYETIGMENSDITLPFPDVLEDGWYTKYVKEAYANDVIDGYPDGKFKPDNSINNAEALKIVMNAFFDVDELYGTGAGENYSPCHTDLSLNINVDVDSWYWKYIYVADNLCILPIGMVLGMQGGDQFNPSDYLTRGQMAEFIYRAKSVQDWAVGGQYSPYSSMLAPSDIE